jgi:hypothetical protein
MAVFVLLLTACPDNPTPPPPPLKPALSLISFDSLMVVGSPRYQLMAVKLYPINDAAGGELFCLIQGGDVSTHFRLYDDGELAVHYDNLGFTDSLSGDRVPGDGVFARRVSSRFTEREGEYLLTFSLPDSFGVDSLYAILTVRRNSEPDITGFTAPDSVPSGGEEAVFSALVGDADGWRDLANVAIVKLDGVERAWQMTRQDSLLWRWQGEPGIAAGIPTGSYLFVVRAQDYYLTLTGDFVASAIADVWLENLPPVVVSVDGPDTVWIPANDTALFDYRIEVRDDQGIADLDSLLLELSRPDDANPDSNVVVWDTTYFDDGEWLDSLAGDGIYTAGFSATPSNRTGVPFTFRWTPTDRSPQRGESYYTTLVLLTGEIMAGKCESAKVRKSESVKVITW